MDDVRTFTGLDGEVVYARHVNTAKRLLKSSHWDEVWLDHDMGYNVPDGTDLVRWIANLAHRKKYLDVSTFYVHSANPDAGDYMCQDLQRLGYKSIRKRIMGKMGE
jgi:hypothetical protein